MVKKFRIGAFMALKSPAFLEGLIEQCLYLDANASMFFAGSPQMMRVPDWKKMNRSTFWKLLQKHQISLENICIHAHYLINLANLTNAVTYQKSFRLLTEICHFAVALKIKYIILHPGSALKSDRRLAMEQVAYSLKKILDQFPTITICLETMSGKGSEVGKTFEELAFIMTKTNKLAQLQVCWDTCHLYAAGYDIKNDLDAVISEFEAIIGLKKLRFVHLNDSQHPLKSHRDRHAKLGEGYLKQQTFFKLINHDKLHDKVWILETPHQNNPTGYKEEIASLKVNYES